MRFANSIGLLAFSLFATNGNADQSLQLGDRFDDLSVEQIIDLHELEYGEVEDVIFDIQFPPAEVGSSAQSLPGENIVVGKGLPESSLDRIADAEANAATRKIQLTVPVPRQQLHLRDGSLDAYLAKLASPFVPSSPSLRKDKNFASTQSGSGDGSCSHAGNSYPDGTRLTVTTCGSIDDVSYGLTCMGGTWVVDFLQSAASICP